LAEKNKCEIRLESPPDCDDTAGKRSYAMCWARVEGAKKGLDMSESMKQGWAAAKSKCGV